MYALIVFIHVWYLIFLTHVARVRNTGCIISGDKHWKTANFGGGEKMGKMFFCLFLILWKYALCFSMKFTLPLDLQSAWLCLAEIGSSSNKLDHSFVVKSWNEYSQGLKGLSFRPLICSWHWKKTCHCQDWQLMSDPYTIKFCK